MTTYLKSALVTAMAIPAVFLINGCASNAPTAVVTPAKVVTAMTVSDVVTVDFDNLTAGEQINLADPNWSVEKVNGTTLLADVSSVMAKSAPNSLYLADNSDSNKAYALLKFANGAAASGSVSFDAYAPSTNAKTVYVNFGVGKSNSQRYFELRINAADGVLEYENGSKDVVIAKLAADQWHTYNATWADGKFTISVDGVASPAGTNVSVASTGLSTTNLPTTITFYAGDTKTVGTSVYIDNVKSDLLK